MSKRIYLFLAFLFLAILFWVFFQSSQNSPTVNQSPSPVQPQASPSASISFGHPTKFSNCQSINGLPDKNCTPGAIDPKVIQENINQTICVSGYTKTVRPPVEFTNTLKLEQIKEYNYSDTNPKDYEEDHLISLELGGAPSDPSNLWPEPGSSPNPKDKIENLCHQKVCDGQISLKNAQFQIATNWVTACQ